MAKVPPPIEGARFCPMIGQGCIGEACTFWVKIWGRKDERSEPVLDEDCAIVWSVTLERESLVEAVRLSATIDKASSESAKAREAVDSLRVHGIPLSRAVSAGDGQPQVIESS